MIIPISRRHVLTGLGSVALIAKAKGPAIVTSKNRATTPGCMLASEQEEGPYYVDKRILRQDITEGKPGIPLRLRVTVVDGRSCTPLRNAALDIWHCDAGGVYSGYTANSPDGPMGMPPRADRRPPGPPPGGMPRRRPHGPSDATMFFRGVQLTGADGAAEFTTVYPGWYSGRDIHIHLKVHAGGHVCHTGQLFFPEDISDDIARLAPYSQRRSDRTRQDDDHVFLSEHGSDFVVSLTQTSARNMAEGFVATAVLGVDPNAEPSPAGFGGPPPAA